jgi:DNA polymerase-3 subunit gamma/tau
LNGRRDLPLAPSPRAGFEMTVLRMLAFRPGAGEGKAGIGNREGGSAQGGEVRGPKAAREALMEKPVASAPIAASLPPPTTSAEAPQQRVASPIPHSPFPIPASSTTIDATTWPEIAANLGLGGPAKELAAHAGFIAYDDGVLRLSLSPGDDHLKADGLVKRLSDALARTLGATPQIRFESESARGETLHQRTARERDARQVAAEEAFLGDPDVQRLMQRHGASVVPDSIRPFDDA